MPNFRRYYIPTAVVFITAVTRHRIPYWRTDSDVSVLLNTMQKVQEIHPYRMLAYVILPDHMHCLMRVEDEIGDFSKVLHSLKRNATLNYKQAHNLTSSTTVWQGRFWDHIIRDERDLEHHFDYIHWNPAKHGYVHRPEDWPHSTYRHWLERGYYELGWGHSEMPASIVGMEFE